MLFILIFALLIISVPVLYDIEKNGENNVLMKSSRELFNLMGIDSEIQYRFYRLLSALKSWAIVILLLILLAALIRFAFWFFS